MDYMIGIFDKTKARHLQIPSLPEEIKITASTGYATYKILDLGDVSFPNGRECRSVEWSGVFYGESYKNNKLLVQRWKDPTEIDNLLWEWLEKGTRLKLIIAGTPINIDATIESYSSSFSGAYGNCYYSIKFKEYRELEVAVIKRSTEGTSTQPETKRNTEPVGSTYTVKYGDTLWGLAYKFYKSGSKYTIIYNANKDVIEAAAKQHGYKNSNNGNYIWVGTVLKIPAQN